MTSRVLVVGGTGMIGSEIARRLRDRGDEVVLLSRRPASEGESHGIDEVERMLGDYMDPTTIDEAALARFDAVAFAAGQDIRHVAVDDEDAAFWTRAQERGVPGFAAIAKRAGIGRFVQIGSYYHQLHPEWTERIPYVAARAAADAGARALSDESFAAITLNPPSIVGASSARGRRGFGRMVSWLRGDLDGVAVQAPPGGTNYMSVRSLGDAVLGALDRGVGGTAYLVGDENHTYREYFQMVADAAGLDVRVPEVDDECAFQPDRFIVQGRGTVIAYEPDPADVALLGYARGDVRRALDEIVAAG